jgi:hypothetical protein
MGDAEYMKYKDPKQPVNTRIKDLIGRMTLAGKNWPEDTYRTVSCICRCHEKNTS